MTRPRSGSPLLFDMPIAPDFEAERRAMRRGAVPVCGMDEAGRGPLAGPVVAASVILDPDRIPPGLDDSKKLSPERRDALYEAVLATALSVSAASVAAHGIDRINILQASLEAMRRACAGLSLRPVYGLVDGRDVPSGLGFEATALVGGDRRSQSIAAASIVAKVTRDRMMARCGAVHAGYGFERHMGYGTAEHRNAIVARGTLVRIHRISFGICRPSDNLAKSA